METSVAVQQRQNFWGEYVEGLDADSDAIEFHCGGSAKTINIRDESLEGVDAAL
jgi:hypothetical protein